MDAKMAGSEPTAQFERKYRVGGLGAWAILITVSLLFLINHMDRQVMAAVLEPMKRDLGFTDAQMGALQTIFMISVGALALPVSLFVDRWSRRKSMALMAIAWSLFTFLTAIARGFVILSFVRFFVGVGEAGYKAGGVGWLSLAFPKSARARAVGVLDMALPLGAALGTVGGGVIAQATGDWRTPFYYFAIPGILLGTASFFLPDYKTIKAEDEPAFSGEFLREWINSLKIKTFLYAALANAFLSFASFSMLGWGPAFYMRSFQIAEGTASIIIGGFLLLGAVGAVLGGWIGDTLQKKIPSGRAKAAFVLSALAVVIRLVYLLSFEMGSLEMTIVIGVIDVLCIMSWLPVNETMCLDPIKPRLRSSAFGISLFICFILGGAWGPLAVGALSDMMGGGVSGLWTALLATLPIMALCPVFQLLAARHYVADTAGVTDEVFAEK